MPPAAASPPPQQGDTAARWRAEKSARDGSIRCARSPPASLSFGCTRAYPHAMLLLLHVRCSIAPCTAEIDAIHAEINAIRQEIKALAKQRQILTGCETAKEPQFKGLTELMIEKEKQITEKEKQCTLLLQKQVNGGCSVCAERARTPRAPPALPPPCKMPIRRTYVCDCMFFYAIADLALLHADDLLHVLRVLAVLAFVEQPSGSLSPPSRRRQFHVRCAETVDSQRITLACT